MGRNVKRIDLKFDWFETHKEQRGDSKTWFGYILDAIPCQACNSSGNGTMGKYCPVCEGEGKAYPRIEPPQGEGWQMWEDTSEGSPISPVFKTPENLARWLADNGASAMGSQTATYEQWLKMIGVGSSPSGAIIGGKIMTGVEAVGL